MEFYQEQGAGGFAQTKRNVNEVDELDVNMMIMIVEDDEALADEIRQFLERWGYQAVLASHFKDILKDFSSCHPHLILMDVNLPYYDGFYWCRRIRENSDIPIIYISSRDDDRDKIMAIAQGGDDYVEKPFQLEILKSRIEAMLRRTYQYKVSERYYLGEDIYFEEGKDFLSCRGREVTLTGSEQKILAKLARFRPGVVTREEMMTELWNTDEFVSDGTLTTLISRLRSKLKSNCGDEIIRTKKGEGYFIE